MSEYWRCAGWISFMEGMNEWIEQESMGQFGAGYGLKRGFSDRQPARLSISSDIIPPDRNGG